MKKNGYFSRVNINRYQLRRWFPILLCAILSCNQQTDTPFPYEEARFAKLTTDSLSAGPWMDLPAPDTLGYARISSSTINLKDLPAKSFPMLEFRDFAAPPAIHPIRKATRSLYLNFDPNTPSDTVTITRKPLPRASIERVSSPKILAGTTTSLLQLGEEEGLNSSMIYAVAQDHEGTKWFSTDKGISRYDGETILTYLVTQPTPQGSFYPVSHMAFDKKGRLWVSSCQDGIYIMDLAADTLIRLGVANCYAKFVFDKRGTAWFGSFDNERLLAINVETLRTHAYTLPTMATSIEVDQKDRLWIGGKNELIIVDSNRTSAHMLTKDDGINLRVVTAMSLAPDGSMWVGSVNRNLYNIQADLSSYTVLDSSQARMPMALEIVRDKRGSLWFIDDDTVMVYRPSDQRYRYIHTGAKVLRNFKSPSFVDRYGVLWLGTVDKGFILLDTEGTMPEILDDKSGLADNHVWGMVEDSLRGNLILSTHKGLNIYERKSGKVYNLNFKDSYRNFVRRITQVDRDRFLFTSGIGVSMLDFAKGKVTDYNVMAMQEFLYPLTAYDMNGHSILMNVDSGLFVLRIRDGLVTRYSEKQKLPSNLVWTMALSSRKDIVWLGTDSGLVQVDSSLQRMRIFNRKGGLVSSRIQRVEERANGEYIIAAQGGISIMGKDMRTVRNISERQGLLHTNVYDLLHEGETLYAGTQDGIYVINLPDTAHPFLHMRRLGKKQGFPFNDYNQHAGLHTSFGQFWWGVTPIVTVLTQELPVDTLPSRVMLSGLSLLDQRLHLKGGFTVGSGGNEKSGRSKEGHGPPNPKGVRWDSLTGAFNLPLGLQLPHDQNTISFEFNTDDIRGRDQIVYSYIMEGLDSNWVRPGPMPMSKTYFSLSPGHYTFKVRAKGSNGYWSAPAVFSFDVLKPWWMKWWALLMYAGALALVMWQFSNFRSRKLKEANNLLEQRVNERTEALENSILELKTTQAQMIQREKMASLGELTAGIAHEIQNPLNFVNNFSEVNGELLADLAGELEKGDLGAAQALIPDLQTNNSKINQHGKRADSIIKSMLQHSRSSTGDKELTDLNVLCDEYLQLSYHGMRAKEKDFNAKITTSFARDLPKTKVVPQDLGRVLMNLLNNAFYAARKSRKFGEPGFQPEVTLKTEQVKSQVRISVTDNGDGIPEELMKKIFQPFFTTKPTGEGTGLGLSLSFDIINKGHNGQLTVQTEPGVGTTFLIQLPILS